MIQLDFRLEDEAMTKFKKRIIGFQKQVYEEALSHYKKCQYKQEELSDTWSCAFDRKGRFYSIDEMRQMFAVGSRVTALIVDWDYLVDSRVYDLSCQILRKLLKIGESDFGNPIKDVVINGQYFSSHFLRNAQTAAMLIRLIEDSGFKTPRVLEIGGGTGVLQFLLKKYFGERLTLFAVDLPETLFIQEWYLRNCFPEIGYVYKDSDEKKDFLEGGLNFINAFTLKSQDIDIDVAINIASMQEIKADIANGYIKYIERNISKSGFLFFKNGYGHSSGSVPQPSEYSLDPFWLIEQVSIIYPVEMTTAIEHLLVIFRRTTDSYDPKIRQYLLRFLWNSFLSGILVRNSKIIGELIFLSKIVSFDKFICALKEITKQHKLPLSSGEISSLISNIYFPSGTYTKISNFFNEAECSKADSLDSLMKSIWFVQSRLIELMVDIRNSNQLNQKELKAEIRQVLSQLFEKIKAGYLSSEYSTAYACSILFALGEFQQAVNLAVMCAEKSKNRFWLVRFAHLLSEFSFLKEAYKIITNQNSNNAGGDKDLFLNLKKIEILYRCGDTAGVNRLVDILVRKAEITDVAKQVFAKTAIRIERLDIMKNICLSFIKSFDEKSFLSLIDIFSFLLTNKKDDEVISFILNFKEFFNSCLNTPDRKLEYGCILLKAGTNDEGLALIKSAMKYIQGSYFKMAWAGRLLQNAGLDGLSENYLERSVELKPNNFKHLKFVADVYLTGNRFQEALVHYQRAAALNPYIRNVRYKQAYCGLPQDLRKANLFGRPSDIDLICQEYQYFYHDIGPHTR